MEVWGKNNEGGRMGRKPTLMTEKAIAQRERYANDQEYREKMRATSRSSAARRRERFAKWRDTLSCQLCGDDRGYALDFHHVEGRDNSMSTIVKFSNKQADFLRELGECVVLCANCHREAHHLQKTDEGGYTLRISSLPRVATGEREKEAVLVTVYGYGLN